jgi:hypothetical protein
VKETRRFGLQFLSSVLNSESIVPDSVGAIGNPFPSSSVAEYLMAILGKDSEFSRLLVKLAIWNVAYTKSPGRKRKPEETKGASSALWTPASVMATEESFFCAQASGKNREVPSRRKAAR